MLLSLLILFSSFLIGYLISRKFFKTELFAPSLLFGIIIFAYLIFLISLVLGFGTNSILATIAICVIAAIFMIGKNPLKDLFSPKLLFSKDSLLVFLFSLLLLGFASTKAIDFSNGMNVVSQDWATHLGIANTLAEGNFPMQYPYLSDLPFSYYYFGHLYIASLVKGGIGIFLAYPFIVVLVISAFISSLYSISRDFFKSKLGGLLSIFLMFFSSTCTACLINDSAWFSPFFTFSANSGFPIRPLLLSFSFNQLPMAFSFLFFAIFLKAFLELEKDKRILLIGQLVALLPMFGAFFFALSFILVAYLLLQGKNFGAWKIGLFSLIVGWAQFLLLYKEKAGAASTLQFVHVELYAHSQSIIDLLLFWFQNAGGHIVLAIIGIILIKPNKEFLKLYAASALLFILASIIAVFPDPWANEKLFAPFLMLTSILAAGLLLKLFSFKNEFKYVPHLLIILALLSSVHQFKFFISPTFDIAQQSLGDKSTLEACSWLKENTPQKSVIFASEKLEDSGCIFALAGRLAFYSNNYWVSSQGLNVQTFENEQKRILSGEIPAIRQHKIDYLLSNSELERKISPVLRANLDVVFEKGGVKIYKVNLH
ncbi:hypothetical protein HY989_03945 [Candidatus Micrarchaeota archaeon]|nr:hypothetical protein [Candidatus Micrarchaeota archaeon]